MSVSKFLLPYAVNIVVNTLHNYNLCSFIHNIYSSYILIMNFYEKTNEEY